MKVHNFSAGPSILPDSVIKEASNGILNINNSGLSLLEISHRSKDFIEIMDKATSLALKLLDLENKGYKALFLQGGASNQFLMTAYNLLENKAGYLNTGVWSSKALKEAKIFGEAIEIASSKDKNFNYIPKGYSIDPDLDYFHITTNNTIFGTQIKEIPNTSVNLVADMSSDIFSRKIDFSKFGLIYAGAQKNMGPAGTTLVVIKEDILGFGRIHIQAKRYAIGNNISREDIQKFVGALMAAQSDKGVFITTSDFTKGAYEYVKSLNTSAKIVLINGIKLSEYIYDYELGMQIEKTIVIKRLDSDYWDTLEDEEKK